MNMRMNKINDDSSEQKYIHLSNDLIKSREIHYTFKIWIYSHCCGFILWESHTCSLFSGGLQSLLAVFLESWRLCCVFGIWIHNVVQLDKTDKAYKAQSHCLMYMLTGLHEVYHAPMTVTLSPNDPLEVKTKCHMGE